MQQATDQEVVQQALNQSFPVSALTCSQQAIADAVNNIFDTISEQSFGDAISVDSFDFDVLDSQDSCGASNPVSTSTPLNQPFSCDFDATSFVPVYRLAAQMRSIPASFRPDSPGNQQAFLNKDVKTEASQQNRG